MALPMFSKSRRCASRGSAFAVINNALPRISVLAIVKIFFQWAMGLGVALLNVGVWVGGGKVGLVRADVDAGADRSPNAKPKQFCVEEWVHGGDVEFVVA